MHSFQTLCINFYIYIYIYICLSHVHAHICAFNIAFGAGELATCASLQLRTKASWSAAQARFDKSESPAENDILLVLDYMQLRLRMLGKSMDCLQESGSRDFEAFTVCSATLDTFGVKVLCCHKFLTGTCFNLRKTNSQHKSYLMGCPSSNCFAAWGRFPRWSEACGMSFQICVDAGRDSLWKYFTGLVRC